MVEWVEELETRTQHVYHVDVTLHVTRCTWLVAINKVLSQRAVLSQVWSP